MGLAGNLSDLSLAELLQMVSLSRKTGVLEICSERGVVWLGLAGGAIVRIAIDGAEDQNSDDPDKRREAAIQALVPLFDWGEGEFTFEPLDDLEDSWRKPPGVRFEPGVSPEFLALECARREDEGAGNAGADDDAPSFDEAAFDAEFGGAATDTAADDAQTGTPPPAESEAAAAKEPPAEEVGPLPPIICVADSLDWLERLKAQLQASARRVHIFQDTSDAVERFKQYIVRGEFPALVLATAASSGGRAADRGELIARVRGLSPRCPVVLAGDAPAGNDGPNLTAPDLRTATDADFAAFAAELERVLRAEA